jgi:hypothetical protein
MEFRVLGPPEVEVGGQLFRCADGASARSSPSSS